MAYRVQGNYLGAIIGGGGMLISIERWGWKASMLTLAVVIVMALIPVLDYKEPTSQHQKSARAASNSQKPGNPFMDIVNFFRRPGIGAWLAILTLYTTGPYMASRMFRPLLVDIGLSLADIGLMLGIVSYGVGILGAIAGGFPIGDLGKKAIANFVRFFPSFNDVNLLVASIRCHQSTYSLWGGDRYETLPVAWQSQFYTQL